MLEATLDVTFPCSPHIDNIYIFKMVLALISTCHLLLK